ncbi:MAG: hypothetical protein KGN02_05670 [bacterium]|nr:hypothetical protein [bacterium]
MIARGCVRAVRGALVEIEIPALAIGCGVRIETRSGHVIGEIAAFERGRALVAPHAGTDGIASGDAVREDLRAMHASLGMAALGRAFGANCAALDGGPRLRGPMRALGVAAPPPDARAPITEPFWSGVKAIDALATLGRGARIGIFGVPGAGKSTLVESIVAGARADAVVVGLVGERGREAHEWIERLDRRCTLVCATSDRAPSERVRAAALALAQARALAARGLHVLLVLDSLARYAAALREIALAAGESVGRGGYPASVFAALARTLEGAGAFTHGSVTLVATVLSDGDERDPISDAARSLLDGHLELSASLAHAGRFPAIDPLASVSRTMARVVTAKHGAAARLARQALAALARVADARAVGIEPRDEGTCRALAAEAALEALLRQGSASVAPARTLAMLDEIADILGEADGYFD